MNPQLSGPWGEIRRASALVGNAITTAATAASAFVAFPKGTTYAWVEGRNYSTAVAIGLLANPWIAVLKTTDDFTLAANATDYSDAAQDGDATTDVVLSSLATSGALWVGSHLPFGGVFADVDGTNSATTSTMAATYWSQTGPTMTTLTITDGSAVTSGTLQVDGAITWTVPAAWTADALRSIVATCATAVPYSAIPLYWVKFTVSVALDSSTTLDQLLAINRSTNYLALTSGKPAMEFMIPRGLGGWGCFQAITDAVTANLVVNVACQGAGNKFV